MTLCLLPCVAAFTALVMQPLMGMIQSAVDEPLCPIACAIAVSSVLPNANMLLLNVMKPTSHCLELWNT